MANASIFAAFERMWQHISIALNGKSDTTHTHNYAGSNSAGGAANSANKLNTNAGSTTQPVYFSNGVPVNTTHTLGASVPSDAKFTDTVYTHPTYTSKNSGLYKITVDNTGHVSATTSVSKSDITALGIPAQDTTYTHPSYTSKNSGLYKITVNNTGHVSATTNVTKSDITALGIPAQDTTYTTATTSAAGLMSAEDKTKLDDLQAQIDKKADITKLTTRNLLDNSDFRNPVNQRGLTSYIGATGYTIDRWRNTNANSTITVKDGCVNFASTSGSGTYTNQFIENGRVRPGKTYTFAVKLLDGTLGIVSGEVSVGMSTIIKYITDTNGNQFSIRIGYDTNKALFYVQLATSSTVGHDIEWFALYEGEYTEGTLPEYQPKGYAEELMECQRYFLRVIDKALLSGHITTDGKDFVAAFMPPIEMRINPTLTMDSLKLTIRTISGYSSVAGKDGASPSSLAKSKRGFMMYLCFTYASAIGTNNTPATAHIVSGYFDFSADL